MFNEELSGSVCNL